MHDHVAALLRQGQRRLPLEVEVLLAADLDTPVQHARGHRDGRLRIPPRIDTRPVLEPAVAGQGLLDRQHRGARRILDPRQPRGIEDPFLGNITGSVLDNNGVGIEDVTIELWLDEVAGPNQPGDGNADVFLVSTVTNADGMYSFNGLEIGYYVIVQQQPDAVLVALLGVDGVPGRRRRCA